MKRILKYPLPIMDIHSVAIPKDGKILCCKMQNERPCIWVMTEKSEELITRHFKCFVTGEELPEGIEIEYIETILMQNDSYVIHIFEIKRP